MKLKTLKELGASEYEIETYEKIKSMRNNRNVKELILSYYNMPILFIAMFFSIAVSMIIDIYLLIRINSIHNFVTEITFNDSLTIITLLFIINALPVAFMLISLVSVAIHEQYSKKIDDIKKEIYK